MTTTALALALSGGGVRATVFHFGVLLRLAIEGRLENVLTVSTVSGGSLAAAVAFSANGARWPSSKEYIDGVLPHARMLLTQRSLQGRATWKTLLRPWKLIGSRGDLLAIALETEWGIKGTMKELEEIPSWTINATTYETGRNWHFSQGHIGDWRAGHNYTQDVPISVAVASSAAIPYMAGFVKLKLTDEGWFNIDPATDEPIGPVRPIRHSVRLWDGGVYDNLGMEAVWKPQRGFVNRSIGFMLVSDASAYLRDELALATGIFAMRPPFLRPPRLFDIATEQSRALRSRIIIDAVVEGRLPASIVRLGRSVEYIDRQAKRARGALSANTFLDDAAVERASTYPTNASRMIRSDFDNLLRHGFETADATLTGHCHPLFPRSYLWADVKAIVPFLRA